MKNTAIPVLVCVFLLTCAQLCAMNPSRMMPESALKFLDEMDFGYAYAGSQLKDYVYRQSVAAFARGDAQRAALDSAGALHERQDALRRDFIASIGGLPSSASPLNAVITGVVRGDGFTIEKVIFESRPHNYVTANLYLPDERNGPGAAVLLLMGHGLNGKQYKAYQGVAQTLVKAGLIVLAQDPPGQGERFSYLDRQTGEAVVAPGTLDHEYAGFQTRLAGESPARYFLHDAMRGIDYLLSRKEVDPARIGVTGNSGGGTQTGMMMMADPRIAAAAPGTFITSREAYLTTGQPQDAEQHFYGLSAKGYDHADFLLAMAPRPVCVLAVTSDFFPIEGTRASVAQARKAWELLGAGGGLELVEDDALHGYTPALAKAAARFFTRELLGQEADVDAFVAQPYPQEVLNSTHSGQVGLDFADAAFIFDENLSRVTELAAARRALPPEQLRTRAQDWLQARVFANRQEVALNPRKIIRGQQSGDYVVDLGFWWTQPGLANMGALIRHKDHIGTKPQGITIALWDGGTRAVTRHAQWLERECASGRAVFVVNLSGMGPLMPDAVNYRAMRGFFGTFHKLVDDLTWLGDSLVALRTFELIRALDALPQWEGLDVGDIRLYGNGRMGVHGKLATLIEPRIASMQWDEPFTYGEFANTRLYDATAVKELLLPGVLQYFDLNEI